MSDTIPALIHDMNLQFTAMLRYLDKNVDDATFISKFESLYNNFQSLNELLIEEF